MKFQYFTLDEFSCPCCGENRINGNLVKLLDTLRMMCNFSFKITSGYRCEKHNATVGGKENSAHTKGLAADIWVDSSNKRWIFMEHAPRLFKRIGISGKDNFIHVDIDEDKPDKVLWVY
jgi:uncharacterized protein YcbK (DUF882 family)